MKKVLGLVWTLVKFAGVLSLLALVVGGAILWKQGALTSPRLNAARDALAGREPARAAPSTEAEADLEARQMQHQEQVRRREAQLSDLGAAVRLDEERLRAAQEAARSEREKLAKEKTQFAVLRTPQETDEKGAARRRVLKSIKEMSATDQVEQLVKLPDEELVEMLKLYKGEAGQIWPLLRVHGEMIKPANENEPARSRFDLVWEKFNKPDPLPVAQ